MQAGSAEQTGPAALPVIEQVCARRILPHEWETDPTEEREHLGMLWCDPLPPHIHDDTRRSTRGRGLCAATVSVLRLEKQYTFSGGQQRCRRSCSSEAAAHHDDIHVVHRRHVFCF
jgi:hypothetical protein